MNKEPRKLSRLMWMLSAASGVSRDALKQGLLRHRPALQQRFGSEAELMISIQQASDPFTLIGGSRRIETAEAIMQVSYPDGWPEAGLAKSLDGLSAALADVVDVGKSAMVFGRAYLLLESPGTAFCGFVGRRDPGFQIPNNLTPDVAAQAIEVVDRARIVFNPPGQGPCVPGRCSRSGADGRGGRPPSGDRQDRPTRLLSTTSGSHRRTRRSCWHAR